MSDKKFQTIIDCGFSKIRAGAFNEEDFKTILFLLRDCIFIADQFNLINSNDIQKIVAVR